MWYEYLFAQQLQIRGKTKKATIFRKSTINRIYSDDVFLYLAFAKMKSFSKKNSRKEIFFRFKKYFIGSVKI